LQLRWLRDRINELPSDNRWRTLARLALREDLFVRIRDITAQALTFDELQAWLDYKQVAVRRCRQVMGEIRASGIFDLVTLSVGLSETQGMLDL
jgi:glutamate dehydrogenase